MKSKLSCLRSNSLEDGRLFYDIPDYSFRHERMPAKRDNGECSMLFGKIQISTEILTGLFLDCDGYTYGKSWKPLPLHEPENPIRCCIAVTDIQGLKIGVGYDLVQGAVQESYDTKTGWYCAGNPYEKYEDAVEFSNGCVIATSDGGVPIAIWLRPSNWRDVSNWILNEPSAGRSIFT